MKNKKFKTGDWIIKHGRVGRIIKPFKGHVFDWEINFIKKNEYNKFRGYAKESNLKKYNWVDFPKSWKNIFRLIFLKIFGKLNND